MISAANICAFLLIIGCISGLSGKGLTPRISGGIVAPLRKYPQTVSISREAYGHICGGTILDESWVLTSASCFKDDLYFHYKVLSGSQNLDVGRLHTVDKVIIHEGFSKAPAIKDDIALIKVSPPFVFDDVYTMPVLLPVYGPMEGSAVTVVGWGRQIPEIPGQNSNIFIRGDNHRFSRRHLFAATTTICTGSTVGGIEPCFEDEGSPLFYNEGELWGIMSFNMACEEPNRPSVFTEVLAYRRWIETNIIN